MKTRLLSLFLVIVMFALVLTGCAYNYEKDDMAKYVTVDAAALKNALQNLKIEDAEFTAADRDKIVARAIEETLVNSYTANKDNLLTDGIVVEGNALLYCYYRVARDESGNEYVVSYANMNSAKPTTIILTNKEEGTLGNALRQAIVDAGGYDMLAKGAYKTEADVKHKLVAGETVYVTFSFSQKAGEGDTADAWTTAKTLANVPVKLGDATDAWHAVGDLVLAQAAQEDTDVVTKKFTPENNEVGDVKYTDITVNYYVTTAVEPLTFNFKGEAESDSVNTLEDGKKEGITDFTYYVYPVSRAEVPTFDKTNATETAKIVLEYAIDSGDMSTSVLPCFTAEYNGSYTNNLSVKTGTSGETTEYEDKVTEATIEEMITALQKNFEELDKLDSTKEGDAEMIGRRKILTQNLISGIVACREAGQAEEDETTVAQTIVDEYWQSIYDEKKEAYVNEIEASLQKAIWKAVLEAIPANKIDPPKKAVDEIYDRNQKYYRYTYETGSNDDKIAWKTLYPTYKLYLSSVGQQLNNAVDTETALRNEATEQAKEIVRLYAIADAIKAVDNTVGDRFNVTIEEVEYAAMMNYLYTYYTISNDYDMLFDIYGENNLRAALLLDKIMEYYMDFEKDDEDKPVGEDKNYLNIAFTFTTGD